MKTIKELNEQDIKALLKERYGAKSVHLELTPAYDDGPGRYSPATVRAILEVDAPPSIAQQTVVMGSAVFGPTHIVMPSKR